MSVKSIHRARLLGCTALVAAGLLPTAAWAQEQAPNGGLEEIVVTAQKREQSMQDVPIAVTAVTEASLQANRIYTVNDLSAIAPGLTVKPSAGGINTPAFTMRGQVSFGVVAGSDKQVSIYVDGVYLSNPRGSIFDLPDIQRLEVLRGPQGTLFGRNATAGAISITTRDPTGDAHVKVEGSYGNYDAYRVRVTLDTPQVGPFSAFLSYVRNYRRGEIQNAGAGVVWDRTKSTDPLFAKREVSPLWLGTVDTNSYFGAVKFEPSDSFKIVYKYDRSDDSGTSEGTGFLGIDANAPLTGALMTALINSQPSKVYVAADGKRPDIVNNSWVVPRIQRVQGHSVTATWKATDSITVKNIFAYRKAYTFATSSIDGLSALTFTPQALAPYATLIAFSSIGKAPGINSVADAIAAIPGIAGAYAPTIGNRFVDIGSASSSIGRQWSDELQVNYSSERLQATLGGLWFHSKDEAGGPEGLQNTRSLDTQIPQSGVIPLGNEGRYFNQATSLAAYAQLEYKITPQVELVAGARVTHDKKTSQFRWNIFVPNSGGLVIQQPTIVPPVYSNTKPNFLVGINWKPNPNTLIYGKWSNSFVSGGSTAGIVYQPETASSFEIGAKADFLDRKLRTNLALFYVNYKHFQSPQSFTNANSTAAALAQLVPLYGPAIASGLTNSLSTFVIDQGTVRAKGFELEVTAAPSRGLTMGVSLGYTDVTLPFIDPISLAANNGELAVTARPKWTGSFYASYETQPLFGELTLSFRLDGQYRSDNRFNLHPKTDPYTESLAAAVVKGYMLLNGRVALRHIKIGPADAEFAFWAKNITNRKDANFFLATAIANSANYERPRTFGVDLSVDF